MDNIVMATATGLPVADGKTQGLGTGKGVKGPDGLFGLLVATEAARLDGSGQSARKTEAQAADPVFAMLMSMFLQGNTGLITTPAAVDSDQTGSDAWIGAIPAGSLADAGQAKEMGGQDGLRQRLVNAVVAGLADGDVAQALAELKDQQGATSFLDLITKATEDFDRPGSTEGTDLLTQWVAAGAAGQTGGQGAAALMQIKQLFIELIAEPQGNAVPAEGDAAPAGGDAVQPKGEPKLTQATGAPVQTQAAMAETAIPATGALRSFLKDIAQALDTAAAAAMAEGQEQAAGAQTTPGVQATAAQAKPADEETGALAQTLTTAQPKEKTEAKTEEKTEKREPADFGAALRAYHGQTARVAGAAKAETKAEPVRDGGHVFDTIVDSITALKNSAQKEMEIRLKPDFLGKVVIRLSMDEGGLVAKIAASNPKVQDAFLSQAASLQSSLADQGLKDVRIVVTSASVQDAALQQQMDRRGQHEQQQNRRNPVIVEAADQPAASPSLQAYEQFYRTGTINYLA